MDHNEVTALLLLGSFLASLIGALSGMGGGVILVPFMLLLAGVEIHYAIGASLVAIVVTSLGASLFLIREGLCNVRMSLFFSTATVVGAVVGAQVAVFFSPWILSLIFGCVMLLIAGITLMPADAFQPSLAQKSLVAEKCGLNGTLPLSLGGKTYYVVRIAFGYCMMFFAGIFSGLLGIGSGSVQVPLMDRFMAVPFKVASATSNFVIGMTAAASGGIYFNRGYIDPAVTMPVVIGAMAGAVIGAHLLEKIKTLALRRLFLALILVIAIHMIYKGLVG